MNCKITYKDGNCDIVKCEAIKYHSSMGLVLLEDANGRIVAAVNLLEIRSAVEVE